MTPVESVLKSAPAQAPRIAILIPCHNEDMTINSVVADFRRACPEADIYVYDNNSSDRTEEEARRAGAIVLKEPRQGKGHVIQSMFRTVDSDVYVIVDGDSTYPAEDVRKLIGPILDNTADMVIGSRLAQGSTGGFHWINRFGNLLFLWLLNRIFRVRIGDLLSGYRAFNKNFVSGTPLFAGGFDTEAEMTIRALAKRLRIIEVPIVLKARPIGSHSKINRIRDGFLILGQILSLFRDYRPLSFFGGIGLVLIVLGLIPGAIVVIQYLETGFIYRIPSAVLAVGLVLSGLLAITVGIILHTIARRFQEIDFQLTALIDRAGRQRSAR